MKHLDMETLSGQPDSALQPKLNYSGNNSFLVQKLVFSETRGVVTCVLILFGPFSRNKTKLLHVPIKKNNYIRFYECYKLISMLKYSFLCLY